MLSAETPLLNNNLNSQRSKVEFLGSHLKHHHNTSKGSEHLNIKTVQTYKILLLPIETRHTTLFSNPEQYIQKKIKERERKKQNYILSMKLVRYDFTAIRLI